jgi:CHAT domain-containing protein
MTARSSRRAALAIAGVAAAVVPIAVRTLTPAGLDTLAGASNTLKYRKTDGRLSGFAYRPREATLRGAHASETDAAEWRLTAVASKTESDNADAHAVGVAFLLEGKQDRAIDILQNAVRHDPRNALLLSDLSVALHERAIQRNFAPDHAAALDAAERAWSLIQSPETGWNRALAASAFHLVGAAERAWDDYLRTETDPNWRREGARHRGELRTPTELDEWSRVEPRLQQSADCHEAVRRFPARALAYFEERVLPRWAKARLSADGASITTAHEIAKSIADSLASNGELLAHDSLAVMDNVCRKEQTCDALARGYARFAEGRNLMERQDFREAAAAFDDARVILEQFHSPYAFAAQCQRIACMLHENEFPGAVGAGRDLIAAITGHRYRALYARTLWLVGLATLHEGHPEESIDYYRQAEALFAEGRDEVSIASIELLLADAFDYAGDRDVAMEHRLTAFDRMRSSGDTKQLYLALFEAGTSSMAQSGWPYAADFLLAECVREAAGRHRFDIAAVASMWRSTIASQRHDLASAGDQARQATAFWNQMTDEGQRAAVAAHANHLELPSRTARPVERLTDTIHFVERTGNRSWLPQLLRQRALVQENAGNLSAAEADFRQAIDVSEQILDNAAPATMRDGFATDVRANYEDMIRLLLRRGDSRTALSYAERARLVGSGPASQRDVLAPINSLPPTTAVAVWEEQSDSIIVWLLRRNEVTLFRLRSAALASPAAAPSRTTLEFLYDALMRNWISQVPRNSDLVLLPPPPLAGVPFAALVDRDSGRAIVDDYSVTVAPNLASLIQKPIIVSPADSFLVVGDPAYHTLPRLPGSETEAREVAGHYARSTLLMEERATAANVMSHIADADGFHFSGHAVANDLAPEMSSLMLASDGTDDTRIYVHELLQRRLPLKLVVLSGCSTAKSRSAGARGTLTIARAFIDGGARAVVGTLWPIPDADAASFSIYLHESLSRGEEVARAVRSAQLRLKASTDDSTWAAFCILRGNAS